MNAPLPAVLSELFGENGVGDRTLSVPLPPGRIVFGEDGRPALWMSQEPVQGELWALVHAEHQRSGLWPLLLRSLPHRHPDPVFSPWESGELFLAQISSPELHDPDALLSTRWGQYTSFDADSDSLPESERLEVTAPFGRQWPGLAPAGVFQADADIFASEYAAHLTAGDPSMRLGLVATGRGADSLADSGWGGPMNYTNDTGEISAVIRDWERRYGVRVVGVGFAELFLSVAAPPTNLSEALHVAAEHFALCPDNVWQKRKPNTLADYAERLVGVNSWEFWWD